MIQELSSHFITYLFVFLSPILLYVVKALFDIQFVKKLDKDIQKDVEENFEYIINKTNEYSTTEEEKDVLRLMLRNVKELREYYVISKQQSRNSFSAALVISILGFVLLATGIGLGYAGNSSVFLPSTISGTIVEFVAGLFFWLYSKSINQINHYHSSLLKTEKFLTAIQLVDKVTPENRDKIYSSIIERIISSDSGTVNATPNNPN